MAQHIWLIGMMGSGKSTVARHLGARLEWEWLDLDEMISKQVGTSITGFWADRGEDEFRDIELAALREVASGASRVVATGGGVVVRDANVAMMRSSGLVIWLQASPQVLVRRIGAGADRPLLQEGERLATLTSILAARRAAYDGAAHASVMTDDLPVGTVVDRIEELWNEFV